jgi:phospholipid/cholesterol/gamma-HCH transport system substrate-binding protein
MPRTRSLAWSELKVGILAVTALALATMLIFAVGGQGGFAWQRYELKAKFPNVQGLKSGAVVRVAGVDVGQVTGVEFADSEVQVTLGINNENRGRITDHSRASIGSLSLLGEPIIEIMPSSEGRPLQDGDYIQTARTSGQIADVAAGATATLEQASALIKEIRAGKGSVGKLFTDDQMYRELSAFVGSAQAVANGLQQGRGSLGLLIKDPAAYREANAALANLQEMTRRINAGEGSLGKLLNDDALARSLTSAGAKADTLLDGLQRGEGTAGKLLTDDALWKRFNTLSDRIDKVVSTLESSEGTAGQLLHDKALYENINGTANELKQLVADIRRDPKKYLNVRVSIF